MALLPPPACAPLAGAARDAKFATTAIPGPVSTAARVIAALTPPRACAPLAGGGRGAKAPVAILTRVRMAAHA